MFNKKIAFLLISTLLLGMTGLVSACGKKSTTTQGSGGKEVKATTYKLHIDITDDSPLGKGAKKFSELIKERTGGKYIIDVYPNGQLTNGNQASGFNMLQNGSFDFAWQSGLIQSASEAKLGVISLPWLWKDTTTLDKTLAGPTGEKLFGLLKDKGIIGLAWGENGFRELTNSKKAIQSPADIKGLKFRVIGNKMLIDIFKELGANPTTMNIGDLFIALQQKTVDGEENPILSVIIPTKFYEVQKHITLWQYAYDAFLLETNTKVWSSLDADTQKIFKQAAVEAAEYQRKLTRDGTDDAIKFIQDKGMTVTRLTPEQLTAFRNQVKPVYETWTATFGADLVKELQDANK